MRPLSTLMTKKDEDTVVVLVHYLAKRIGEVKPGADIREWDWLAVDALPDDVAPNIRPIVDEARKLI